MNVSDFIVKRLAEWGVERVFGHPGEAIDGVVGAFHRSDGRIRFIQARHEEAAAFMACGHAKFTGTVGVCLSTSGPGAIHLLAGLYDAKMDHVAVVAIVGQAPRDVAGGDHAQGVDLPSLFKDVARDCVQTVATPESAGQTLDRALRIAQAGRTVTCVIVPADVQEVDAAEPRHAHDRVSTGLGPPHPLVIPNDYDLNRAADVLNGGKRVAILVGAGAAGAGEQVVAVANLLGAGVAKALLGRTVVPDDLPFVTGAVGIVGTRPSHNLFAECDTLLTVGSSFPYPEFLPREGRARGVQIDIDARLVGARVPAEVELVGDARVTLDALIPRLEPKDDKSWREQIAAWRRDWNDLLRERAALPAIPINPQRVFTELSSRLPDRVILTADGACVHWFARDLTLRHGMMASLSGSLGATGSALPYAIAAKFAHPRRPVVAFAGDDAMQTSGNAELLTIAKYFREWPDPRLIVAVLRSDSLVSWQTRLARADVAPASHALPRFPYASYAELVGLRGIHVDDPRDLGPAWERALSADRPAVLEIMTDPDVLPLPPHVSLDRARAFALALPGDALGARGLLKRTMSQMLPRIGDKLGR